MASPDSNGGVPAAESRARIQRIVEQEDIELIRFLWVDHNSVTRGKAVSRQALPGRMDSGIGLARSRQASSLLDLGQPVPGFDAVGEVRLVPDPDSFVRLPHAPGSAAMLCDLLTVDGDPWDACPRTFLKEALAAAGEYQVVAAFEPEFTLCSTQPSPGVLDLFDDSLCFDNEGFDAADSYTVDLLRALRFQGLTVETYHPEFGAGQHEMTLRHAPALRAADNYVWQRATTRGTARRKGLWATFAPVPAPGMRGNGNHAHLSLWQPGQDGRPPVNLFADPSDELGLSTLARHFIGGLLAHLPGLTALTNASVNSYHRLRPGMWAGAFGAYGLDNREAAIRIPTRLRGDEAGSTNVEVKICDSTANPYLALGALVHAGMDGVRRGLDPGEPLHADPNRLSADELRRLGVTALPRTLEEAVDALERDEFLMSVLGPARAALYPAIKRADVRDMKELGSDSEYFTHAVRF
ncbi:glutamine synthetase family protein [Kitasatospora sp. NPDC004745]|uniref:glutamine synthetase family protein n=1 Tax=unclassified Kitasatospora TaxID=2633591 RepID=UPI0033EDD1A1